MCPRVPQMFTRKSCACQSAGLPISRSATTRFCRNCRGHRLVKSIDLQILQRKLQQLPYHLPCSVDLCRKSSIFFATSPLSSSFGLRHLPCTASLSITTNRLEIEGPVQQERGETFQGKKVLAVSSFVSFGGSALVHQPSSSEPDDLETQNRSGAVHRHARHYANQTLRVVRAGANLPHCHLLS